jgi:hypothetical protein
VSSPTPVLYFHYAFALRMICERNVSPLNSSCRFDVYSVSRLNIHTYVCSISDLRHTMSQLLACLITTASPTSYMSTAENDL